MNKLFLIVLTLTISGCVKTSFNSMQSAKMLDKGEFKYSPFISSEGGGIGVDYGLNEKTNLTFKIETISVQHDSARYFSNKSFFIYQDPAWESLNDWCLGGCADKNIFTVTSLGVKLSSKEKLVALHLPISITTNHKGYAELITIKPEIIATGTFGARDRIEISYYSKLLIPSTWCHLHDGLLFRPKDTLISGGVSCGFNIKKIKISAGYGLLFAPLKNISENEKYSSFIPSFNINFSVYR